MVAYFAPLSFVPLVHLALALLGVAGRADESSHDGADADVSLDTSVERVDVVETPRETRRSPSASSAASSCCGRRFRRSACSESAFNIVYGH